MHDPSNSDVMDAAFAAKFFLYEQEIPFTANGDEITLHTEGGDVSLKVVGMGKKKNLKNAPEEDENIKAGVGDYSIDDEVEKLAGKANSGMKGIAGKLFGTSAQKAKSAVNRRSKVARDAVGAFDKGTERIKKGIQNVKRSATNVRY